ncbi:hypothetical protein L6R52_19285 [Myxococcota bacterium]|nr:hypothetical protein [Myxococcota bacterium]
MTKILRVRTYGPDGSETEHEFDPDVYYLVDDRRPEIDYLVEGQPLSPKPRFGEFKQSEDPTDPLAPTWRKWTFGQAYSSRRRLGVIEAPLKVPKGITLRCYAIPQKLLSPTDFWAMVEDIEAETDRQVAWEATAPQARRSWESGRVSEQTLTDELCRAVERELLSALGLMRHPIREPAAIGRGEQPVPELAIVSHWTVRRVQQLRERLERLTESIAHYDLCLAERPSNGRAADLSAKRAAALELRSRAEALRRRASAMMRWEDLSTPVAFTALAQRDPRLRNLLSAFSPPRSELAGVSPSKWSAYSPVTLNDLFERWGAVWIARQLRALGFAGPPPEVTGSDNLATARWSFRRGTVEIILDYEPHPRLLDLAGLPPLGQRHEPAARVAARTQVQDVDRPLCALENSVSSPDYVLRVTGPRGTRLAVGDASLADPAHNNDNGRKFSDIVKYRSSIHWWTRQDLLACDRLGAFLILPGPREIWSAAEDQLGRDDVWLVTPLPGGRDGPAKASFGHLVTHLASQVGDFEGPAMSA